MDRAGVMQLINDLESKYPVTEWKVSDFHVWPFVRITLGMSLYRQEANNYDEGSLSQRKTFIRYISRMSEYCRGGDNIGFSFLI